MKHELKTCPCCKALFECKVGSIHLCQCWTVPLTEEERMHLKESFDECLCARCLLEQKQLRSQRLFDQKLKKLGLKTN
ncbi:cysteine-rich CWC family protein [Marinoscillum furvescens]|uniref:Cysteine-rich CWC n=1 Tax=Marinoscillum furvescens DSM 4134 TaxID=1122208 RepID=A0A3D9L1Q5_MARFU|nr:cysteine-rich CWC family protein [Marinoscillum furvescens]RED97025.1 hypothetical protein C7460_11373 [Marinoscillum furvescens DSM 4134]